MSRGIALRRITAAAAVAVIASLTSASPAGGAVAGFRAFSSNSYWNTRLPEGAPVDQRSDAIIDFLKTDSSHPYVRLVGTESDGGWGEPIFWAKPTDPVYNVVATRYTLPPEFDSIRIPAAARVPATSDAQMTIYDLDKGAVYKLQKASYNSGTDRWSAGGGSYYYLGSNGLHGSLSESNNRRNFGHRGNPPALHAVRWDEIQRGAINHMLKIAVNTAHQDHVWPMVGSDGDATTAAAPPQGARIRIKPGVELSKLGLSPAARVIARALQDYGAVIGDSSGGPAALKVENTVLEGRGWLWKGVLNAGSLQAIPFRMFEVVRHGYKPGNATEPDPDPKPDPDADVLSVPATADTFVDADYPLASFGERDKLRVRGENTINGLVRFDVPAGTSIEKATLRLYSLNAAPGVAVRAAAPIWTESTSWATAPPVGQTIASSDSLARNAWTGVDVTSYLQGGSPSSFYLTGGSTTTSAFSSGEGPAEVVPRLRIVTN